MDEATGIHREFPDRRRLLICSVIESHNSVALKDGTVGSLKLPYKIPKFKLPLKIDVKLLKELTKEKIDYK
jgi:hypothetical protein